MNGEKHICMVINGYDNGKY